MAGRCVVVVLGDSLLDRDVQGDVSRVCPDAPVPVLEQRSVSSRPGGAALAASLIPAGIDVVLVSAVATDRPGEELAKLIEQEGVDLVRLTTDGSTPEKIRFRSGDHSLLRLDRGPCPGRLGPVPSMLESRLRTASAVLVSDYGRGVAAHPGLRSWLARCGRPVVWDPHPRGPEPVAGCRVVTPNTRELSALFAPPGDDEAGTGTGSEVRSPALGKLTGQARRALVAWQAQSIAVTRGDQGALLVTGDGPPLVVPPERRLAGDSCGAGDCFAASLAGRLAAGGLPSEAVTAAVADAFSFVAAGAAPAWFDRRRSVDGPQHRDHQDDRDDRRGPGAPDRLVSQVRARGGTVVATGGCFDLLHAGHLSVLRAARALGDCLIVCLNSDRSVRRLKGPTRPVIPEAERAALLATLECVDAVCVFDEDTPDELLARLRPDIWAKGGDYDANNLPEAATVAGWGGQTVTVPYLSGHSTTDLLRRAATGGG